MVWFASDIHLGGGEAAVARATERRFVAWLDRAAREAHTVVLAGDVFDFWFEYGRVVPQGCVRALGKLAELTDRGLRVVFFTGNHDMWVGDYLARECGLEIHTRPEVLELEGQRIFVAHGDNMNIRGDLKLVLLNKIFRSRVLRRLFAWGVHPDLAMRFGRWWSDRSRRSHPETSFTEALTEPLIDYARSYVARGGRVDHFVFGHMHYARDYREAGLHTIHLGGWDRCASYAVLDGAGGLTLRTEEQ